MPKYHKEIFTAEQVELLPMVRTFTAHFGLVGGTAIALHIGHRRSIDFDMFSATEFNNKKIRRAIEKNRWRVEKTYRDETGQFTFVVNKVQMTFFHYPFAVNFSEIFEGLKMPDLLTLAAMKAYALGGRNKWKDYVDLYFIIKDHFSVNEVSKKAKQLFEGEFNERIFREQLGYFDDMNYAEKMEFMPGFEVDDETVKKKLIEFSLV